MSERQWVLQKPYQKRSSSSSIQHTHTARPPPPRTHIAHTQTHLMPHPLPSLSVLPDERGCNPCIKIVPRFEWCSWWYSCWGLWSPVHHVLQGRVALDVPTPFCFRTHGRFRSDEDTIATIDVSHFEAKREVLFYGAAGIRLGRAVRL